MTHSGWIARLTDRGYSAALRLYPRSFRERCAGDMQAFVRAQLVMPEHRGWRALKLWPGLALDFVRTLPSARLEALSDETRGQATSALDVTEDVRRYPEEEIMDVLLHDIRFALRTLRRRRAYAITAILTLALGIGATTAIFSVVNAVLLRPLPFPDADRVVMLWAAAGGKTSDPRNVGLAAYTDVMEWRERSRSFESIGIMRGMSVNLTGGDKPDRLSGMFSGAETFSILGARTILGRTFTADEAKPGSGAAVAVLSHDTWQSRFGSDPGILGRTLLLNARPTVVIGVLSPDFYTPMGGSDVWLPMSAIPSQSTFVRGNANVWATGRLRPNVSIDAARRELNAIAGDLARQYPQTNEGVGVAVISMRDQIVGSLRGALLTIFAAVALLLVIACANVANLQLARAASRVHEIAMRTALGAASGRIIRQLLTESVILALVGGAVGVLFARWMLAALVTLVPGGLPTYGEVSVDGGALVFALAVSVVSALLFGLVPALRSTRSDLRSALGVRSAASEHGAMRGGAAITVAQLALCTALLIVGGLLTRSLTRLRAVSPGFDASHVLGAEFRLPVARYATDTARAVFFTRLLGELRSIPGVEDAALASWLPLTGNFGRGTYEVEGAPALSPAAQPQAYTSTVTDQYFHTMGIPLVTGRDFTAADRLGAVSGVIVNQTLAQHEWPGQSPLGQRIRMTGDSAWLTVVGVVADSKEMSLSEPPTARLYGSFLQSPGIFATIALRTNGDPARFADALRRALWSVDREQPVWRVRPMAELVDLSTRQQRFTAVLTISFAALALLLGAIGVYGVMSYSVSQRTREMGLRIAVGATTRRVMSMVIGRVLRLSVIGAVFGVVLGAMFARALAAQLYGITPHDPLTFAGVPLILLGVAIVAAAAPARRASRVDPMVALRSD